MDHVTPEQFVKVFPEFCNKKKYPEAAIEFYLELAYIVLNAARWGRTLSFGIQMFTAHNLVLEAIAQAQAAKGAPPVGPSGPASSKSAGPVSISWDTGTAAELNAGHWNETIYGKRYIRMCRLMGAGGLQLGIGIDLPLSSASAWVGPPPWPGWFSS